MPKRSSKKPSSDPAVAAFRAVSALTGTGGERPRPKPKRKNAAAVALGRRGGKVGGKRRAELLTKAERSDIARRAAAARWAEREPE